MSVSMHNKRKGLTPIIATVLLLMLTIVAFGMAYLWLKNMQTSTQNAISEQVSDVQANLGNYLSIISVYKDSSSGNIVIVVKNTGNKPILVDLLKKASVLIDGVPVQVTPPSHALDGYASANYIVNSPFTKLTDGNVHTIKLVIAGKSFQVNCGPLSSDAQACNI